MHTLQSTWIALDKTRLEEDRRYGGVCNRGQSGWVRADSGELGHPFEFSVFDARDSDEDRGNPWSN